MRLIDGDKVKEKLKYSMLIKMGFINDCNERGIDIDKNDELRLRNFIEFHKEAIRLIDEMPTMQSDHIAIVKEKILQNIKELEENGKHHAEFVQKNARLVAEGLRMALDFMEEGEVDETDRCR